MAAAQIAAEMSGLIVEGAAVVRPHMSWSMSSDGVKRYDDAWLAYTGSSMTAPVDWCSARIHHPDELRKVVIRWQRAVEECMPFSMDLRLRGGDGAYRWFSARVLPERDHRGALLKWSATFTSIEHQREQLSRFSELYQRNEVIAEILRSVFRPAPPPIVPGVHFQAVYRPAEDDFGLGGDWYDVIPTTDARIVICIGDIVGHGVVAASGMIHLREMARAAIHLQRDDPASSLELINGTLRETYPDVIATAVIALYDMQTKHLVYASAGHPAPVLVRNSVAVPFPYSGLALGVESSASYSIIREPLRSGDTVVFYTDGLLESEANLISGEQKLLALLSTRTIDADSVVRRAIAGQAKDDVALVCLTVD